MVFGIRVVRYFWVVMVIVLKMYFFKWEVI